MSRPRIFVLEPQWAFPSFVDIGPKVHPACIRELPSGEEKDLPPKLAKAANGKSALSGRDLRIYLESEFGVRGEFWVVWDGRSILMGEDK